MSIYDFIDYANKNPLKFIDYCEIIINEYGGVLMARPSHIEAAVQYIMKKEKLSRKEVFNNIPNECSPLEWIVDKYGLIAVWYSGYIYSAYKKINRAQKKTIKELMRHSLINNMKPYIYGTHEYCNYLKRKELFGID